MKSFKRIGDIGMVAVVVFILSIVLSFNFNSMLAYYYLAHAIEFQLGIASLFIGFFGISHIGHFLSQKY
jgi:uncharacterized membrane protein YciS (DUF1049 family)